MYVGPWQEFKAMERARIAEQHASMAQMAQRRGQPPADQNMADELERLRRALELVSGELPPEAAHKVRRPAPHATRTRDGPASLGPRGARARARGERAHAEAPAAPRRPASGGGPAPAAPAAAAAADAPGARPPAPSPAKDAPRS